MSGSFENTGWCISGAEGLYNIYIMEELHSIFRETGGSAFFENIERRSDEKAREMGFEGADDAYFRSVFTANSGEHGGK